MELGRGRLYAVAIMGLRALIGRLSGLRAAKTSRDAQQLAIEFAHAPRTGVELLAHLKAMGLRRVRDRKSVV